MFSDGYKVSLKVSVIFYNSGRSGNKGSNTVSIVAVPCCKVEMTSKRITMGLKLRGDVYALRVNV